MDRGVLMPCTCWIDDESIEPEMKIIRDHCREIVRIAKVIHSKGDLHGRGTPTPRHPLDDVHILLDDLFAGKCSETVKEVK